MKKIINILAFLGIFWSGFSQGPPPIDPRLESLLKESDSLVIVDQLEGLMESDEEEDWKLVVQYYNRIGARGEVLQILEKAIKKFPRGDYAFTSRANAIVSEKDPAKKEKLLKVLETDFSRPREAYSMYYFDVVNTYAQAGDLEKAKEVFSTMDKKEVWRYVTAGAVLHAMDPENLKSKEKFLSQEIRNAEQHFEVENSHMGAGPVVGLELAYANLLMEMGKKKEALKLVEKIYYKTENKNKDLFLSYAVIQAENDNYDKAFPILERAVKEGYANEKIRKYLKLAYTRLGKVGPYEVYLQGLTASLSDSIYAHLEKIMVKEEVPAFELKDVNGKVVNYQDFAGKTLVLDFWATWCGPCIKSFPTMQKAERKFASDPGVQFLFVHTLENDEDPLTAAVELLKEGNYDFDLYMDYKDSETHENPVANSFGIRGLPTKIVVGPDGYIRFKVVGFSGGVDAGVEELSTMIQMARSPKK